MVPLVDKPVELVNSQDSSVDLDKSFDIHFGIRRHSHHMKTGEPVTGVVGLAVLTVLA